MHVDPPATLTEQILDRICGEYIEMPGLCLTRQQAQRLWGLNDQICSEALELLVDAKFLCHTGDMYRRLTDGPIAFRLRMARAELDQAGAVSVAVRGGLAL